MDEIIIPKGELGKAKEEIEDLKTHVSRHVVSSSAADQR